MKMVEKRSSSEANRANRMSFTEETTQQVSIETSSNQKLACSFRVNLTAVSGQQTLEGGFQHHLFGSHKLSLPRGIVFRR